MSIRIRRVIGLLTVLVGILPAASMAARRCEPAWTPGLWRWPGTNGEVDATTTFDDGTGPALYAGGSFSIAGGAMARNIARWDGRQWSSAGSLDRTVRALVAFDGDGGPALYAGGDFLVADGITVNHVARWDGTRWSALGTGTGGAVHALAVFDDGSGPALYAAGLFATAGGTPANHIAKWDGTAWSALAAGTRDWVSALAVFDDGNGCALYAGGESARAGDPVSNGIAKWDGRQWSPLGSGVGGANIPHVYALAVFDDGHGPALYAGGLFGTAGDVTVNHVAKWSPGAPGHWVALGSGVSYFVYALTVFDNGNGPALYAAGQFDVAGGAGAAKVAGWDGTRWSALPGGGTDYGVYTLGVFDEGDGPALYAGGGFYTAGNAPALHIARWKAARWSSLADGLDNDVRALTVFDDGDGPALYAGGEFHVAGDVSARHIAKWTGRQWSPLANGTGTGVRVLTTFDDGGGPALYAGGTFLWAGNANKSCIARWDGTRWSALGNGISGGYSPCVSALAVFDDGYGAALYAGGAFTSAGGVSANNIAKWDGRSWSALGNGTNAGSSVDALAVFDDGHGPALYAGGSFTTAGDVQANCIAKWDGTRWSPLGSGMATGRFPSVLSLAVFDDGSGRALYAGGYFTQAGGVSANYIAKWDGNRWWPLGTGMKGLSYVYALTVFDDGGGLALYAGGRFDTAGEVPVTGVARWDGAAWSPLGTGVHGTVFALEVFDSGSGPALHAGGSQGDAGGNVSARLARWGCQTAIADLDFDGDVDLRDFRHFQACFNGPNEPPAWTGCDDADIDGDADVDLEDFLVFSRCFNGPNRPPACP